MHKKVLKTTPSLFLWTPLRTVTPFLFFSLGKKKVGGNTIIHTIRINLPSHFGYAILIIIDILQQKLKDFSLPYDTEKS
mgnify:CR=1 FL=1